MDNWETLQDLWQTPRKDQGSMPPEKVLDQLRSLDRKNKRATIRAWIINALTLIFLITIFILFPYTSPIGWIGMTLVCLSLLLTFPYFQRQANPFRKKTISLADKGFIQQKIMRLRSRLSMANWFIPLYAVLLIAGINFLYFEILSPIPGPFRIMAHGGTTLIMILAFIFGLRNFKKQFKDREGQLIKELEAFLGDLQR